MPFHTPPLSRPSIRPCPYASLSDPPPPFSLAAPLSLASPQLGKSSDEQQQAAALASMLGSKGEAVAAVLATAAAKFRTLPVDELTEDDMLSNADTGLHAKTSATPLGKCDAFISHSWKDDGRAKYAALREWADEKREKSAALSRLSSAELSTSSALKVCAPPPPPPPLHLSFPSPPPPPHHRRGVRR